MSNAILLIEDNTEMRENIAEILELASYKVSTAPNGKLGVKAAIASPPDLIICDIMMPEMDGYEALYLLSKNEETKNIPFIFLSAKAENTDLRKGMNLGADDYLVKPFEEMELLQAVEVRLKRSNALRGNETDDAKVNANKRKQSARECLQQLIIKQKEKTYAKKEILFHEGDFASSIHYIEEGKVKTYKTNEDAKSLTTGLHKKGDFLGFREVIENVPFQDSAMALEKVRSRRIHKDEFLKLLSEKQELSYDFMRLLSKDLIEKEQELINLAYNSVRKRVADSLLLLKKKYPETDAKDFTISIAREELASIAGTSTESVIRVLSDLKDEHLIAIKGSTIKLLDEEQLGAVKC